MKLNIVFKHLESSPSIEAKIQEKAAHLKKYFNGKIEISWVCSVEKNVHRNEVNVHAGHGYFHAKADSDSLYKSMDIVLSKIERQIRRKNSRVNDKIHSHHKEELAFS